jgi:glycosyltransferase involved in cell wall biosynthesis
VGHDKAQLIMHTQNNDPAGQNLMAIVDHLQLTEGQVQFSEQKVSSEHMASLYNLADCTINIPDAEGFGLSALESLSCETPIIATMTGGLQEQITDGRDWFGIGLQPIPWIYEDRLSEEQVVGALLEMYNKTQEERKALGEAGRAHVMKDYNFKTYQERWTETIKDVIEKHGSWETRTGYNTWELMEVA